MSLSFIPLVASAQIPSLADCDTKKTLACVINDIIGYLNLTLYLLMAIAILMFVWNVINYFIKPNENRKDAGTYVMYSVIGFFVILSIWGIVNIVNNTFGLGNSGGNNAPATWSQFNNIFPR